jgi:hypothetical protein
LSLRLPKAHKDPMLGADAPSDFSARIGAQS